MNFRIYERKNIDENKNMKFYFIEGTAPDSVEDGINTDDTPPNGMERTRDIDKAITDIAEALVNKKSTEDVPTLVFMVHGFNNPRDASLKFFENAASQVMDPKVFPGEISRGNIVFIGYRWPSEKMLGGVLRSSVSAMPIFALCLLSFSLAAFIPKLIALIPDWFVNICNSWASNTLPNQAIDAVFAFFQSYQYVTNLSLIKTLYLLSTVSFSVFTVLALLRAIVYFRDNYRAINHGAPDLVEIIRQIDSTVLSIVDPIPRLDNTTEPIQRKRIHLSLIGHSMGGLVATNALRILTDVFDQEAIPRTLSGLPRQINKTKVSTPDLMLTHDQKRINLDHEESLIIEISKASKSEIKSHAEQEIESHDLHYKSGPVGNVFTLKRLLLISPDIPAETLLSDRANFLAPSLKRFREAYLFSNEGDEVLRMISPIVNYFSFPTKDRKYGYRLGNVEILNKNYPDRCPTTDNNVSPKLLEMLRVGSKKLIELCHEPSDDNEIENTHCDNPADIAKMFTYIDCTDYIDGKDMRGMLTYAKNMKKDDAEACLTWIDHLKLLLGYILNKVNVHGGYFEGEQSQRLIYRLACLGWEKTLEVYGFEEQRINYPKLSGQTASWLIDNEVIAYQILGIRRLIKLTKEHQVRVLLSPYLSADLDKILANEPGKDDIDTYFPINISSQSTIHPPYIEEDEDWLVIGGARIQKHPVI